MTRAGRIAVGVLIGALYAGGMTVRGDLVPGLVGGLLAGTLCVLVLREVEARRRRRLAARQRPQRDAPDAGGPSSREP